MVHPEERIASILRECAKLESDMKQRTNGAGFPKRAKSRQPEFLYAFLILSFVFTLCNQASLKSLPSIEVSSFSLNPCNTDETNTIVRETSDQDQTKWFEDNLKLERLIGNGDVSFAFRASYKNRTVVAKIATDSDLYYSDIEIGIFRELNAAPSIPNIPQLQVAIRSMPNPFRSVVHLVDNLGVKASEAKALVMKRRISVMVMEDLGENRSPKDLEEVQRLTKSMLETMEFVHSRNIMHCDLHKWNYHWDGTMVRLFDWNGGFFYEPNTVKIHYPRTPKHLFPPEALADKKAIHTSVHAFDIYTIGSILKQLLKSCCGIDFEMIQREALDKNSTRIRSVVDAAVAYELATLMTHEDPYTRPTTTQALRHLFFSRTIYKKRQAPKQRPRYIEPEER
mmetsp:Transcript_16332/g.40945  ORF Transcript_16332/g.40945 Transcript_16332/m.40945 type:complete len:396 (+) Transcript_16332:153-1340(+)